MFDQRCQTVRSQVNLPGQPAPVTEYTMLEEDRANDLARRVNEMLEHGWKLYGNPMMVGFVDTVSCDWPKSRVIYAQAMVK